jgi:tRNA (guanosine-2'-O-)-methyltransferase
MLNFKSSLRIKAEKAKKIRCKTLTCVLENPKNIGNVAAVIRNIDALGIGKLYIIDGFKIIKDEWEKTRKDKRLKVISSSACKWTFIKRFDTVEECFEHLSKKNTTSYCTSPHIQGKFNTPLFKGYYNQKNLAIWFGNESKGLSEEAIKGCKCCVKIEMGGIVESMNLACCTGIVMWYVAQKRRNFK